MNGMWRGEERRGEVERRTTQTKRHRQVKKNGCKQVKARETEEELGDVKTLQEIRRRKNKRWRRKNRLGTENHNRQTNKPSEASLCETRTHIYPSLTLTSPRPGEPGTKGIYNFKVRPDPLARVTRKNHRTRTNCGDKKGRLASGSRYGKERWEKGGA